MTSSQQAIIQITTTGKNFSRINYSRRMYAIIRRYTPDVSEGDMNECFADLTGLRTFFNMTYKQIAEKIRADLTREIGIAFTIRVAPVKMLLKNKTKSKNRESITTYKEINSLFAGSSLFKSRSRANMRAVKRRFTVPFIGKVN